MTFHPFAELHRAGVGEAAGLLAPGSPLHETIRQRLEPGERVAHVSLEPGRSGSFCIITNHRLLRIHRKAAERVLDVTVPNVQQEPLKRVTGTQLHRDGVQIDLTKGGPWVVSTTDFAVIAALQVLVRTIVADPPGKPRGRLFIPLAASGIPVNRDGPVRLEVTDAGITLHSTAPDDGSHRFGFGDLVELVVGGPGLEVETTGGGMMGGGFGLVGFAVGAAAAAAYNRLTTSTQVSMTTILTVVGHAFEVKLLTREVSPAVLEDELAPARIGIRQHAARSGSGPAQPDLVEKLQALATMRADGILSDSDFERAKEKLLGGA